MFNGKKVSHGNKMPQGNVRLSGRKPVRRNGILQYSALIELVVGFMGLPNTILLLIMYLQKSQPLLEQLEQTGVSVGKFGISVMITLLLYVSMTAAGFLGTFSNGKKGKENLPYIAGLALIGCMVIYMAVNILVLKNLFNLTAVFWCIIHLFYCHGAIRNRQTMLLADR